MKKFIIEGFDGLVIDCDNANGAFEKMLELNNISIDFYLNSIKRFGLIYTKESVVENLLKNGFISEIVEIENDVKCDKVYLIDDRRYTKK